MFALVVGAVVPAAPTPAPADTIQAVPAPLVVETLDPTVDVNDPTLLARLEQLNHGFTAGAFGSVVPAGPSGHLASSLSGGMSATFDAGHPSPGNVQTVVMAAVSQWEAVLATSPSGPVNVAVTWSNLGQANLLGSAGPSALYAGSGLPDPSMYYPTALVNTLRGTDANGATPELTVNLNSAANWYIGTSGTPGGGQSDLYSVMLHELGHGLGFLGSASDYSTPGTPSLDHPPFGYDGLVTYNTSMRLVELGNADSVLRSNSLGIKISSTQQRKLYAPGSWQEGSSFSHFDEASYPAGSPGALMTPVLTGTEVERTLDGPTLGVMANLGWPMDARAITPTLGAVSTTSGSFTVNWNLNMAQAGVAPDGFRAEAWRDGVTLDGTTDVGGGATAATVGQLHGGASYTIRVVPYAHGIDGPAASVSSVLVGTPTAPSIVRASGGGLSRTISWSPPGEGGVSSYDVERSGDGQSWTPLGSTSGPSLDATLSTGIHQFRVRGHNGYGAGQWGYSIPTGVGSGVVRPVPLDGQISRLYQAYFRRNPDASGFYFWQGQRAAGLDLGSVSSSFAGSTEFVNTYGSVANDSFVDLVYANVLGRVADPGGRAYWISQLGAGVSRGAVMAGFSESAELVNATATVAPSSPAQAQVYRLYVAFFLRFPDAAGYQYWTSIRSAGTPVDAIAAAFAGSSEFALTYGPLPDDRFVALIYANVLSRSPDSAGAAYWQGQLSAGVSRGSVMSAFSQSPEFVIATGTLP